MIAGGSAALPALIESTRLQALWFQGRTAEVFDTPWIEDGHRLLIATHQAGSDDIARRRALDRYQASIEELGVDPREAARIVEQKVKIPPRSTMVANAP